MHAKVMEILFGIVALALVLEGKALAQDHSNASAQANNPLANMTAFNIQDYYIGKLTGFDDSANQVWFRFAKPFSKCSLTAGRPCLP